MRTGAKIAIGLVLVAAGSSYMLMKPADKTAEAPAQEEAAFPMPVEGGAVLADTLVRRVEAAGSLAAYDGVMMRPEIAGRVKAILFTEGQKVEQGQPLVQMDDSIYKAQLEQAEAEFALASRNNGRAKALVGRGAGTVQSSDTASAALRQASAAVSLAQANLDKALIRAPFAGVVGIRQINVGDFISAGRDMFSLQDSSQMKVDFSVPETALAQLAVGQKVEVRATSYPDKVFTGAVTAIDPLVDPNTRSVAVRGVVKNEDHLLRGGQFAAVTLITAEQADTPYVPASAIWPVGQESFVFKVTDGKALRTKVEIAQRESNRVAIASGIAVGDIIVTAGQLKIANGDPSQAVPVNLVNMPPAQPAAAEGAK